MKFSRRSLFGTLLVTPLAAMAGEHKSDTRVQGTKVVLPYNPTKVEDIVDMLLVQLVQQLEEDGVRYPTDYPLSNTETLFTTRAVHVSELDDSIDQVLAEPCWARMRCFLSQQVQSKGNSEACVGRVLAYTEGTCPDALIFEFRAINTEDRRGKPDGLIYYRNERVGV